MPRKPPTTYQLLLEVERPVTVAVGRLGTFAFPNGRYVYTGSARRNFEARIARHLAAPGCGGHLKYLGA